MAASHLALLISLSPTFLMLGLAYAKVSTYKMGRAGIALAIILGVITSIYWSKTRHAHVPIPDYVPFVFIVFLTVVSLAIIIVIKNYLRKVKSEKPPPLQSSDE